MTDDELIEALARLLTRTEDRTTATLRNPLLQLALRIRALLLTLPALPGVERTIAYAALRPRILPLLQQFTDFYAVLITNNLPGVATSLNTIAARYLNLTTPLPTPPLPALLDTATVLTRTATALLTPGPTGLSPFTLQLERLLDTSVRSALFRNIPTTDLANTITPTRTITRGTVASAWLERTSASTAALTWSLVTPALTATATAATTPITRWRWNAILDPRTCPICAPLHNTTAPTPNLFPSGAPPLHPRCRCVAIPLTS